MSTAAGQSARVAEVVRETGETKIRARVGLDGTLPEGTPEDGASRIEVPDGFFAHMLDALSRHGGLALDLRVEGDTHVDLHHTVEDTGIALGEAIAEALGERRGVVRFAHAYAPLDEALARAVVDLSGRGFCRVSMSHQLEQSWVTSTFPLTLVEDFVSALADRGRMTLHLDVLEGRNPHHVAEACFKALALALRGAVAVRAGAGEVPSTEVPSTKGTLVR